MQMSLFLRICDFVIRLIYTEAVMLEVFRNSSIVPFGVFHSAMEDVTFHGYNIPKDTVIMGNLWEVHHDKEVWGNECSTLFILIIISNDLS